jgi:hypothetical protein
MFTANGAKKAKELAKRLKARKAAIRAELNSGKPSTAYRSLNYASVV